MDIRDDEGEGVMSLDVYLEFGKVVGWDSTRNKCLVAHPTGVASPQHADARVRGIE